MKLSHRIFLGYFLLLAIAGVFLLLSVRDELRPAVRQSLEETMVETANLLAEIVENNVEKRDIRQSHFAEAVDDFLKRKPAARIWGLSKNTATYRIYITDEKGIVLYDSDEGKAVGEDYSEWNDVYLTLRGLYGARSTPSDPNDPTTSVMYVAAPIEREGEIIGVLTVSKPNVSVLPFIRLSQRRIAQAGLLLFAIALILGWVFSRLITRSTQKLVAYANQVSEGKKAPLPNISEQELAQLGQAIESMRQTLEGHKYAERYIHTLTHEIKSPLSAIRGASELLAEEMSVEDRSRFIQNIKDEAGRIQHIVDRLLDLAKLEQQQVIETYQPIDVEVLVEEVLKSHDPDRVRKSLTFGVNIRSNHVLSGDLFLVRQAIHNIVDNAIDFSPEGGVIEIKGEQTEYEYVLSVEDQGDGVPEYAERKIFERFYSLPRPETGKKSSGLGLSFVKEIMKLHGGRVQIQNVAKGCRVTLTFPIV